MEKNLTFLNTISSRHYYPDFKDEKQSLRMIEYLPETSQLASVRMRLPTQDPANARPSLSLILLFALVLTSSPSAASPASPIFLKFNLFFYLHNILVQGDHHFFPGSHSCIPSDPSICTIAPYSQFFTDQPERSFNPKSDYAIPPLKYPPMASQCTSKNFKCMLWTTCP